MGFAYDRAMALAGERSRGCCGAERSEPCECAENATAYRAAIDDAERKARARRKRSRATSFPEFRTLGEAECFNCDGPLDPTTVADADLPRGHGALSALCRECKLRTWFDIEDRR